MALKIDLKNIPSYVKYIVIVVPSVIISLLVVFLLILPKHKEIAKLDKQIDEQNNKIAEGRAKVAKLDVLMKENEALAARLKELKEQLPEEKDVASLLKLVSDLVASSGLDLLSWRPQAKVKHPSGIIEETPMSVTANGTYHTFGTFLGNLTKLPRIVSVKNIQFSPRIEKGMTVCGLTFTVSAFSSVTEEKK